MMGLEWDGTDEELIRRIDAYGQAVMRAIRQVADYFAPIIEASAKENASWIDHTSNARQGLYGYKEDLAEWLVGIYLSHSMEYGIWLEVRNAEGEFIQLPELESIQAGRYAIVLPTLEEHYPKIMAMIQEVLDP